MAKEFGSVEEFLSSIRNPILRAGAAQYPPFLALKRKQKLKSMQLTASQAATVQRRRLRGLGRASTLLTGGRGVLGEAPVVRKSLLGQ
ncbi:MAG: hypothetical protein V3W19_15250 [Desulfatiglandales bacterium]